MPDIPFTQYLRPNGRKVEVSIDRQAEIADLAERIIARGFRFEVEHLTTGHVSLSITHPKNPDDVHSAMVVVMNGPEVPAAVDRMIKRFADEIGEMPR